jgi:hypothetical protein
VTLCSFGNNIGNSTWYNINRKYYYADSVSSPKTFVNGQIKVAKTVHVDYSHGKAISGIHYNLIKKGNMIPEIIQKNIDSGSLPEDTSAVYFFLTAGDVTESIRPDLGIHAINMIIYR